MTNYSSSSTAYVWTGLNTQNQAWSVFNITEDIILADIQCYWGGYNGASTSGYHCVWNWTNSALGGLVVQSSKISVGSGQAWHTANVTDTYVSAGYYAIGVWADPANDRIFPQYNSSYATTLYLKTATSGLANSGATTATDGSGVLPIKLDYYPQGGIWVNDNGTYKEGRMWVNDAGTWKKARGMWVNNAGTWQRNQG